MAPFSAPASSDEMVTYRNAVHGRYSARSFGPDERQFADVLDSLNVGVWARNPARGSGYGIQLPVKVGTSNTFYPDFLWWIRDTCYAIDPTGAHILNEKVRGKLLAVPIPKIVLITRGRVSRDFSSLEAEDDGWSTARPRAGRAPTSEHFASIRDALARMAKEAGKGSGSGRLYSRLRVRCRRPLKQPG